MKRLALAAELRRLAQHAHEGRICVASPLPVVGDFLSAIDHHIDNVAPSERVAEACQIFASMALGEAARLEQP